MTSFGSQREGVRYLVALRQHWKLIALIVIVAVAAAVAYSSLATERYEAEADVLVTPVASDDPTFAGIPLLRESGESRAVLTVARLIQAPAVADGVKRRLRSGLSRGELLEAIEVAPQEQSTIVTVTGSADNPREAAAIANGFAAELIAQRTKLFQDRLKVSIERARARLAAISPANRGLGEGPAIQARLEGLSSLLGVEDPTLQLASPAAVPVAAAWPKRNLSIAVALLTGLLLGSGLAVALELVNPRIKREDDLVLEHPAHRATGHECELCDDGCLCRR